MKSWWPLLFMANELGALYTNVRSSTLIYGYFRDKSSRHANLTSDVTVKWCISLSSALIWINEMLKLLYRITK